VNSGIATAEATVMPAIKETDSFPSEALKIIIWRNTSSTMTSTERLSLRKRESKNNRRVIPDQMKIIKLIEDKLQTAMQILQIIYSFPIMIIASTQAIAQTHLLHR
jgi:hypothetical protein